LSRLFQLDPGSLVTLKILLGLSLLIRNNNYLIETLDNFNLKRRIYYVFVVARCLARRFPMAVTVTVGGNPQGSGITVVSRQ